MRYPTAFALCAGLLPMTTSAAEFTPERRDAFVAIVAAHDCRFHNQSPAPALIADMTDAGFGRDEIRAIGKDLIATGDGVIEGGALVVMIGPCAR